MRLAASFTVFVALATLLTGMAAANQPDPGESFFDDCVGRSPKNDTADPSAQYVFGGVLNNASGNPVSGYTDVVLEILLPCANPVVLAIPNPSAANGEVLWDVATLTQGGGACESPSVVEIRVGGQVFKTLDDVRSPDMDGDTFVALADLSTWQGAFRDQTPIYLGDLDCDGFIALGDLSWWQKHFTAP